MKIETYISQLLYRYQCVTVPGFGAFLTEIQSAKIDDVTATFFPPTKTLSFNSYLQNNDGLLANHISMVEKITYDEAVGYIKIQVFNWKERLNLFGLVAVKNVGEFSLNTENKLVFKPFEQLNYLTDSFGLSVYNATAQPRNTAATIEPQTMHFTPMLIEDAIENEVQNVNAPTPIVSLPVTKNKYHYLKYAAVFAISMGAAGLYGYRWYENKIVQETLLVQTKVQKQVTQKIQEATFLIQIPEVSESVAIENTSMPFHVVAGAFRNEKNADKELQNLLRLGFDAKRMDKNESGLYPVIYGSYPTYARAHEEMAKIKKTNTAAWVLIQE